MINSTQLNCLNRLFNVALKGPGKVWISSMPMEKLQALFPRPQPQKKKKNAAGALASAALS